MSNDTIKNIINRTPGNNGRKLYGLPDGDIDTLLEEFRENNFTSYRRKGEWILTTVYIMNNDGNIYPYNSFTAVFRYINKWKQEEGFATYTIIVNKNNKIQWIGRDSKYFVSYGERIYSFSYQHKEIMLFPNICTENKYFDWDDHSKNDNFVTKTMKEEKIGVSINLESHFEKGFFYKGPKWNTNWTNYYGWDYITIFIDIYAKENNFYIEIENITYPFYGVAILDLNDIKIIEAKKI